MSTTTLSSPATTTQEKRIRKRKSHPKVRTGCQTCKIRRKKCGEERPCCVRCTSTGRKCDGYSTSTVAPNRSTANSLPPIPQTQVVTPKTISSQHGVPTPPPSEPESAQSPPDSPDMHQATTQLTLPRRAQRTSWPLLRTDALPLELYHSPALSLFATSRDYFTFDFFRRRTAPEFSGHFDSSFWQGLLIQACLSNPTIRQAAVALGAVHRRFELGITPEAFEYCDFALRSYTKALKSLQDEMGAGGSQIRETAMIASMLLSAFEAFQGNHDVAAKHMLGGLKIMFTNQFKKISSQSQRRGAVLSESSLKQLFAILEERAGTLFNRPVETLDTSAGVESLPDVPSTFADLETARDYLFAHVKLILQTLDHAERDESRWLLSQQHHLIRLVQWSCAYAEHSKNARKSSHGPVHERPFRLLRTYREAAYLLILSQTMFVADAANFETLGLRPELPSVDLEGKSHAERHEVLNAHFAKLLVLADGLVDAPPHSTSAPRPGQLHSWSVDSGIMPPLVANATSCKVRQQATSLIQTSPATGRGDFWKTLGPYMVTEILTAMECEAVLACGALPEEVKPRWVDVTCFLEERKLLLRYCVDDKVEGGLVWTQDWIAF